MTTKALAIMGFTIEDIGFRTIKTRGDFDPSIAPFTETIGDQAYVLISKSGKRYDLTSARKKYNNSGRIFKFTRQFNKLTEEHGWVPKHIPTFDPVNGGMVIHDLMEHLPGNEYGVAQEYIAQGGVVALRYNGGFFGFNSDGVPGDVNNNHIDPAFRMLFKHMIRGALATEPCPMHPMSMTPLSPAPVEHQLYYMLVRGRAVAAAEFGIDARKLEDSMTQALGWMRLGYRLTQQRYKGMDLRRLAVMFKEAAGKVDALTKASSEGDLMTIQPFYEENYVKITHTVNTGPGNRQAGASA